MPFVKNWQEHALKQQISERRATRNDVMEIRQGLLDLHLKNSIVVIASADVGEDYYLLKVISDQPEILTTGASDDWNAHYPAGAKIIRGHFYKWVDCSQSSFKLIADKTTYVYSSTVCFICSDLQELAENGVKLFMVSGAEHLDILDSLDGF